MTTDGAVLRTALLSRALTLALMVLADGLLPDHSSDAAVFPRTCEQLGQLGLGAW